MKKYSLLLMLAVSISIVAQVGIGTTTPDNSAILELKSTDKGLIFPRVPLTSTTDDLTVPNPVPGLCVYNTTINNSISPNLEKDVYCWDGRQWKKSLDASGSMPMVTLDRWIDQSPHGAYGNNDCTSRSSWNSWGGVFNGVDGERCLQYAYEGSELKSHFFIITPGKNGSSISNSAVVRMPDLSTGAYNIPEGTMVRFIIWGGLKYVFFWNVNTQLFNVNADSGHGWSIRDRVKFPTNTARPAGNNTGWSTETYRGILRFQFDNDEYDNNDGATTPHAFKVITFFAYGGTWLVNYDL
ncbi:MAG: hypothetical protein ACK5MD_10950 [Flavobacteriales bacterium]